MEVGFDLEGRMVAPRLSRNPDSSILAAILVERSLVGVEHFSWYDVPNPQSRAMLTWPEKWFSLVVMMLDIADSLDRRSGFSTYNGLLLSSDWTEPLFDW